MIAEEMGARIVKLEQAYCDLWELYIEQLELVREQKKIIDDMVSLIQNIELLANYEVFENIQFIN